ncbi:hypothetical protein [Haloarchaeobius sp. HRN-SO-5]|uniref:hypothetical protein n=1 Tax=Haloarchaeobius sp. HRN-SO-5 TaxID=3446118 RepID=UPI003EBCB49F
METFTGEQVAEAIGTDLAARLGVDEGEFTADEVAAITDVLGESAALAESVAEGDADLATLFTPSFVDAYTDFPDYESFLDASPWTAGDVAGAFSGATGTGENPAATDSTFLDRTTEFSTPGAMVQAAIIDRTRREIETA